MIRAQVLVCGGTGCTSSGSKAIQEEFVSQIEKNDLENEIKIVQTGCFGLCSLGPVVIVYPDGFVKVVDLDEFEEALDKELLTGDEVKKALRSLDSLLRIIYDGRFPELQKEIEDRI